MVRTTNKKAIALLRELGKSTDNAAQLIHKLTGQDLKKIKAKGKDQIMQELTVLLARLEKEDRELNWRNDKSSEHDTSKESHAYEKEAKGIYVNSGKLKDKAFGAKKPVYEYLKILSALQGYLAARRAMAGAQAGAISVNPFSAQGMTASVSLPSNSQKSNIQGMQNLISKLQLNISNDNTSLGVRR